MKYELVRWFHSSKKPMCLFRIIVHSLKQAPIFSIMNCQIDDQNNTFELSLMMWFDSTCIPWITICHIIDNNILYFCENSELNNDTVLMFYWWNSYQILDSIKYSILPIWLIYNCILIWFKYDIMNNRRTANGQVGTGCPLSIHWKQTERQA